MSLSHITISSDSNTKSVGSPTSHVILSDSEATVTAILDIAPEIALEAQASSNLVPALPDYVSESDPKESPEKDPLEDDSSGDDISETAGLEVQAAPAPPVPLQITPAPPAPL
ncbi:hypothetical protein Tco_0687117 [Tanacetum coccineum]